MPAKTVAALASKDLAVTKEDTESSPEDSSILVSSESSVFEEASRRVYVINLKISTWTPTMFASDLRSCSLLLIYSPHPRLRLISIDCPLRRSQRRKEDTTGSQSRLVSKVPYC